MGDSLGLPPQTFFQNIFLGRVKRFEVFSVQDVLRPIFHKLGSSTCLDWNEVFLRDLLFKIVLTDDSEESALDLLQ